MHAFGVMVPPVDRTADWPFDNEFWPERELLLAFARDGIVSRRLNDALDDVALDNDWPPRLQGGAPSLGHPPTSGGRERRAA